MNQPAFGANALNWKKSFAHYARELAILSIIAGAILGAPVANSIHAQSATWNAAGASANWSDSTKWTPGTVPNAIDAIAIFNNNTAGGNKIIGINGQTIGTLSFEGNNATATTTTLQLNTLFFQSSGTISSFLKYQGPNIVGINSTVNLGSDLTVQAGTDPLAISFASALTLNGSILGNGHNLAINAGNAASLTTLSGAISGVGTKLSKPVPARSSSVTPTTLSQAALMWLLAKPPSQSQTILTGAP